MLVFFFDFIYVSAVLKSLDPLYLPSGALRANSSPKQKGIGVPRAVQYAPKNVK